MSKLPYPNQSNLLITVRKSQEDKSNHTLGQRRSYPNNVAVNCINSKEFTILLRDADPVRDNPNLVSFHNSLHHVAIFKLKNIPI